MSVNEVSGKHSADQALPDQPTRKKQRIEKLEEGENLELSFDIIPIEVQERIFSFLFRTNEHFLLFDLVNEKMMRKVVLLSRVSHTARNTVFSAFCSKRDGIINPLINALERMTPHYSEVDLAKGASTLCLEGMQKYPVRRSMESELLSFKFPTPHTIDSLVWGINAHWNLNDGRNSTLARREDCLVYFGEESMKEMPDVAGFLLRYLSVTMDDNTLIKLLLEVFENGDLEALSKLPHGSSHIQALVELTAFAGLIDLEEADKLTAYKASRPDQLLKERCGKNMAHIAAVRGKLIVLKWLKSQVDIRFTSLLSAQDAEGKNIAHLAASNGQVPVLKWLNKQMKDVLLPLLTSKEPKQRRNIAHLSVVEATEDYDVLKWIWGHENLHHLLYQKDNKGYNALHLLFKDELSQEMLDELWEMSEELHDLFLEKDGKGRNIAHISALHQRGDNVRWIMRNQALYPLLFEIDDRGNNVAHYSAQSNNQETLHQIDQDEKLQPLLREKNLEGENIAHKAGRAGLLEPLLWIAERKDLHELFYETDLQGQNVAHLAAKSDSVKILNFIANQPALVHLFDQKDGQGRDLKAIATASKSYKVLEWIQAREKQIAETGEFKVESPTEMQQS